MILRILRKPEVAFGISVALILLAAVVAYYPGLSGSFLFDDYVNLSALGDFGRVDNWTAFWRYITSGIGDPTGRPLTMLSFLIDARNWPADPWPFKRTSLLIHLSNGVLLFLLLVRLEKIAGQRQSKVPWAALVGAGLWTLHPLWVSSTLYIVQRAALLSTMFVLLGLLGYLHGRMRLIQHPHRAMFTMIASIFVCTLLAMASKANGVLLPLFVLVLEFCYLRVVVPTLAPEKLRIPLAIAVYPPVLAITGYLIFEGVAEKAYALRPWTVEQRLLTESRVLMDYLNLLLLPRPYSRGLFNDDYLASFGLVHPWTTLPAILLICTFLMVAWLRRKRYPVPCTAILFFFAGHAIESTTVPLELYFEHRNYAPALLLFWPLAQWATHIGRRRVVRGAIVSGALLLCIMETWCAASLSGDANIQAMVWAAQHPQSARAQTYAALKERELGRYAAAQIRLQSALKAHPNDVELALNLIGVRCSQGSVNKEDMARARHALETDINRGNLLFDWFSEALETARKGNCRGMNYAALQMLIDATRKNVKFNESPRFRQRLLIFEGQLDLATADIAGADEKFRQSLLLLPTPDVALEEAAILGSHGLPEIGLDLLNYYHSVKPVATAPPILNMDALHQWLLIRDGYWQSEIVRLRALLNADVTHN